MNTAHLVPSETLTDGAVHVPFSYMYAYTAPNVSSGYAEDTPGTPGYVWIENEGRFLAVICKGAHSWVEV